MPTVTIPQALELAIQHHEAGRLRDAEVIYRQILASEPNHAEAHHLLGLVAHQCARSDAAEELIGRAIALGFDRAIAHSNLGEAYRALGRLDEAIAEYRSALRIDPEFTAGNYNLGVALRQKGGFEAAADAFRRVIKSTPDNADAYSHLGASLAEVHRLDDALVAYRHALRLRPDRAESWFDLGAVLRRQGHLDEAIVAYRRSIASNPTFADGYHNLGAALVEKRDFEEAIAVIRRELELVPDSAGAHYNLGNALQGNGCLDEAVDEYHRALELRPAYLEALNNLGNAHAARGELEQAAAIFRRAMECEDAGASVNSNLLWVLQFMPGVEARMMEEEMARWNRRFRDPVKEMVLPYENDRNPDRRLRIGYVSSDFRDHTLGRNLMPLFQHHNRRDFEIVCYAGVLQPDGLTDEFRRHADQWHNTVGVSDEKLAAMIRRDEVDILVDLALHTAGNRLPVFAREPAPVQVSFAGYPGSTGVESIRYRISDRYLESGSGTKRPSEEENVCLIDSFWCYDACGMEVLINDLPAGETEPVTFGSLNNFRKINERVLKLWGRVIKEVSGSHLILLSPQGEHRQWVLETLKRAGVAENRVEFVAQLPRKEYLELYHRVDVMLDPFPYNGHTTSLDAMWMGVPVITLAGEEIVSRAGLSQLSNLGLHELTAFSGGDYVRIAVELADDLPRLAQLRRTLRSRMETSVLMDGARFARGIESAYRAMWRDWCNDAAQK